MPNLVAKDSELQQVIFFEDVDPHCDLDLDNSNPTFLHENLIPKSPPSPFPPNWGWGVEGV